MKRIRQWLRRWLRDRLLRAEDVEWIVNNYGELGVKIDDECFFLYKGYSLSYDHDREMSYRPVGKREFGETCKARIILEVDPSAWKPLP